MPATPLRHRRIDHGLTQLELALKAGGVSATRVSLIERRVVAPTSVEAVRLATALGCAAEELFPLEEGGEADGGCADAVANRS